MAKPLNQAELSLDQYIPTREPLIKKELAELLSTEMPTVGQLLGLILEEDQTLLKLAQADTAGKISLFSADADRITGQITATDNAFRAKVITPNIAPEQILTATSAYRDSLAQLDAQKLKVSRALEELDLQAQQLKNAKSHSGKLESGLNTVIEKIGDRPIPLTFLAALFSIGLEKPTSVAEQTVLPTVDLDQIAIDATTKMASLHTRQDEGDLTHKKVVAKLREHRKYQTIAMPTDLDLNQILLDKGIDLARLEKETGKPMLKAHVIRTMPKFIATDLRLELNSDTINEALELMANDAITTEDLKGRESLSILVEALKANAPAPAPAKIEIIEQQKTLITTTEGIAPVTIQVSRDAKSFDPKLKETKPILVIDDNDPLALVFTRIAKNDYLEITEPGLLAAAMTGKKVRSEGRVSAAARKTAMEKLQTNIIALTDTAKRQGILTLDKLADSNDIKIPDEMRTFFRNKCQNVPIANLAVIEGQIAAGYHQEKAKTLDQLALKLQKRKLSGN